MRVCYFIDTMILTSQLILTSKNSLDNFAICFGCSGVWPVLGELAECSAAGPQIAVRQKFVHKGKSWSLQQGDINAWSAS